MLSGFAPDGETTLGTPIAIVVRNKDQRSGDYKEMEAAYRPSHADATYDFKYGVRAVAGGGRSSARETIGRVAAGAVAKELLRAACGTEVIAYVSRVRDVELPLERQPWLEGAEEGAASALTLEAIEATPVRCPDAVTAKAMYEAIDGVRVRGESCGGVVTCVVRGAPKGLGSPAFGKLEADLASALMSLPAAKGFEVGSGFEGSKMLGSEHNDEFYLTPEGALRTRTNRSGGIQGGISNGEPIVLRVAFKPTATITRPQHTVARKEGGSMEAVDLKARGRHDPCVVPRAVPIVEAMVALTLADALIQHAGQCELLPRDDGGIGVDADVRKRIAHRG